MRKDDKHGRRSDAPQAVEGHFVHSAVSPAKAGIHGSPIYLLPRIPAFAGYEWVEAESSVIEYHSALSGRGENPAESLL